MADEPSKIIHPATPKSRVDGLPATDADATLDTPGPAASKAGRSATEPKSIGRYQLLQKLGEGGMGQVWLAEQTAPVRRQVTLKLIRTGMYDDSVLQRFQSERQSLALVVEVDGKPTPRIIDFGIAKVAGLRQRAAAAAQKAK